MKKKVLVLREKPFTERTPRNFELVYLPLIKTTGLQTDIPRSNFDSMILTSANSVRYLGFWPRCERVVCLGPKTQSALPLRIKKKSIRLKISSSDSLIQFFKKESPQKIFFPRSAIGDPRTVRRLRELGHKVTVRKIYTTRTLYKKTQLHKVLKGADLSAILVTSPSVFKALKKNVGMKAIKGFDIPMIAMGPTTYKYMKSFDLRPIQSSSPALRDLLSPL